MITQIKRDQEAANVILEWRDYKVNFNSTCSRLYDLFDPMYITIIGINNEDEVKIKDLLDSFRNGISGLEDTIKSVFSVMQDRALAYTNKSSSSDNRLTERQKKALSCKQIASVEDFKDVLDSVVDEFLIWKCDFTMDLNTLHSVSYTYYACFTDKGQNVQLFDYLRTSSEALSPDQIIIDILGRYKDSVYSPSPNFSKDLISYDHVEGRIVQRDVSP